MLYCAIHVLFGTGWTVRIESTIPQFLNELYFALKTGSSGTC